MPMVRVSNGGTSANSIRCSGRYNCGSGGTYIFKLDGSVKSFITVSTGYCWAIYSVSGTSYTLLQHGDSIDGTTIGHSRTDYPTITTLTSTQVYIKNNSISAENIGATYDT